MFRVSFNIPQSTINEIAEILTNLELTPVIESQTKGAKELVIYCENPEILKNYFEKELLKIEEISDEWGTMWYQHNREFFINDQFVVTTQKEFFDRTREVIKLMPAKVFGDGHHPTTFFCANELCNILNDLNNIKDVSLIDIGTGTGLLSILAAKMGVKSIDAIDNEELAIENAHNNFELNELEVDININFQVADIYHYKNEKKYDIVVANLLSQIIIDNIEKLSGLINSRGVLIVSGIGNEYQDEVETVFSKQRLKIVKKQIIDGWTGYLLTHL